MIGSGGFWSIPFVGLGDGFVVMGLRGFVLIVVCWMVWFGVGLV